MFCEDFVAFGIDKRRQKLRALLHARPGRPLMLDYYHHPGLFRWAQETLARERIDIVYIFSTAMAPYVLHHEGPRRILDMQDIDSEKWTEYAKTSRWPMRAVWAREGRTLFAYERAAAMACERTLFVSDPECRRFAELAPQKRATGSTGSSRASISNVSRPMPCSTIPIPTSRHALFSRATWITGPTPMPRSSSRAR